MSWRDTYTGKGKFRDAEFLVKSDDMDFGRRVSVHEYPLRDLPYVEDIGKKAREFNIDAFVIGPDYNIARDALIAAIEKPGPGTMVHPYLGTMRVSVTNARKRESSSQGGRCQFTLTMVVSGENTFPDTTPDTPALVAAQADKTIADSLAEFEEQFNVVPLVAAHALEVEKELDRVTSDIDSAVGTVAGSLASIIRTPVNLGAAIVDSVTRISDTATEPKRALNLYSGLFGTGDDAPAIPLTTKSRQAQSASTDALHNLVKRGALIEACRASSQVDYDTYSDAIRTRDMLLTELDVQMLADGMADAVYLSLADLRVAIVNDIRARGADLSRINTHVPTETQPALVIAHDLYGDAGRDGEIVMRNAIRHPGFVQGGEALEVLNV